MGEEEGECVEQQDSHVNVVVEEVEMGEEEEECDGGEEQEEVNLEKGEEERMANDDDDGVGVENDRVDQVRRNINPVLDRRIQRHRAVSSTPRGGRGRACVDIGAVAGEAGGGAKCDPAGNGDRGGAKCDPAPLEFMESSLKFLIINFLNSGSQDLIFASNEL
ncbi:hypothetical protein LR48_Vigan741s000600 [Vigna angularis]|uniref:Uncharacterized protein n=1 Tax=Phaseolus angularis TaxID=3914 RepID=A0A0L9THM6_PHAAN|nr:hypothetical protein LR48_Vigan741s000600 [Vigna angularis]